MPAFSAFPARPAAPPRRRGLGERRAARRGGTVPGRNVRRCSAEPLPPGLPSPWRAGPGRRPPAEAALPQPREGRAAPGPLRRRAGGFSARAEREPPGALLLPRPLGLLGHFWYLVGFCLFVCWIFGLFPCCFALIGVFAWFFLIPLFSRSFLTHLRSFCLFVIVICNSYRAYL